MFEGPIGKEMLIKQGYVPPTCTLDVKVAGPLIYSEVSKGRSPCWGCHESRRICKGQPYRGSTDAGSNMSKDFRREPDVDRSLVEGGLPNGCHHGIEDFGVPPG